MFKELSFCCPLILVIFSLMPVPVFADFFHCRNADGSMSFQDKPCKNETVKVEKAEAEVSESGERMEEGNNADSEGKDVVVTRSQLLGRWTDMIDPELRAYRSYLVFSSSRVKVTNPVGVVDENKYEFDGKTLTFYYLGILGDPNSIRKRTLTIKSFDGKKMTLVDKTGYEENYYKL